MKIPVTVGHPDPLVVGYLEVDDTISPELLVMMYVSWGFDTHENRVTHMHLLPSAGMSR